jgi:hypothetical protein
MRIKAVTLYDDNIKQFGDVVSSINKRYADANGYEFCVYRHKLMPKMHASWSKLRAMQQELDGCDWAFWVDADILFVNKATKLSELCERTSKSMLISSDSNGVCCGFFGLRNCAWSVNLLSAMIFLGEMYPRAYARLDPINRWEQNTFKSLLADYASVADGTDILSDAVVQNPDASFNPNALAFHYWYSGMSRPLDQMLDWLKAFEGAGDVYTPACRPFSPGVSMVPV